MKAAEALRAVEEQKAITQEPVKSSPPSTIAVASVPSSVTAASREAADASAMKYVLVAC